MVILMPLRDKVYHGRADWASVRRLLQACQGVPPVDLARYPALWRLRILVTTRLRDERRDARLWLDDAGRTIGFAALFRRPQHDDLCELEYVVYPTSEGTEAAAAVLAWALARVSAMAAEVDGPIACWGEASAQQSADGALLEQVGFVRQEPYVQYMERALVNLREEATLPDGFTLHTQGHDLDLDAYLALYNAVSSPLDRGLKEALMHAPEYDPTLDVVVLAPDGRPVAFCEASCGPDDWADGRRIGWIDHMGTHPDYQRLGLGEALLATGLQRVHAAGATRAALFTDSSNEPAQRLYARLGFYPSATATLYALRGAQHDGRG